ncbi:Peptidyl-prolyl cis-trans isomerase FKBP53 [Glycine soja]|uniref:Peptidyl-prolyl cis-trans isomerase FKBP53 n=1 Tax=Glycine soja TaxID=3848 RepID=A0A0B2R802_GLYSO|nr:Peptidyl-prolyl cis-trans isomerase FKBP53 [Glycine soja]
MVFFISYYIVKVIHGWGEDIEGTESEESSEYDSEDGYANDFIVDSDTDMYLSLSVSNSGVVIEEIMDDDNPENGDDPTKKLKKKKQVVQLKEKDNKSSELPIVSKGDTDLVVESIDEDGFPITTAEKGVSVSQKTEAETKGEQARSSLRRKTRKRPKSLKGKLLKSRICPPQKKGKKQTETKPSQVRTFPNGLIIEEELFMGKPDGKKAAPGKKTNPIYHRLIFLATDDHDVVVDEPTHGEERK